MINSKTILNDIELLESFRVLVETYETMAATSMRRVRNSVLQNRTYHLGLNSLYQEVKQAYRTQVMIRMKRRDGGEKDMLRIPHSGKTILVLLSANTGLYGDIIQKTFSLFSETVKNQSGDVVVVGRVGKTLFEENMPGAQYRYFDFPDDKIEPEQLKVITDQLKEYEKVIVFYGAFKNFVEQTPSYSDISGDILGSEAVSTERVNYFFEPSIGAVAYFFETEIFASLLEQVFHESRLAKLASRMVLLDGAMLNIDGATKKLFFKRQQVRHSAYNRKQLDQISGALLWENNQTK
ncbi:MAG: F0F1 ATP synthase subunit gamma [Candidatus Sungbacteria bacterium]|nr:F0F1 ATP synthase subunit gamma [Candidatus Sungbacteria bacterium]